MDQKEKPHCTEFCVFVLTNLVNLVPPPLIRRIYYYLIIFVILSICLHLLIDKSETDFMGAIIGIVFSLLIFFGSEELIREKYNKKKREFLSNSHNHYWPCPNKNCNKSMSVFHKWKCNYCNNHQEQDMFICIPCQTCGRSPEKSKCEHCNQEFQLFNEQVLKEKSPTINWKS